MRILLLCEGQNENVLLSINKNDVRNGVLTIPRNVESLSSSLLEALKNLNVVEIKCENGCKLKSIAKEQFTGIMSLERVDFSNCEIDQTRIYRGANGKKLGIKYNNEIYMLKFPALGKAEDISYSNSAISEYISCHIFESIGFKLVGHTDDNYFLYYELELEYNH